MNDDTLGIGLQGYIAYGQRIPGDFPRQQSEHPFCARDGYCYDSDVWMAWGGAPLSPLSGEGNLFDGDFGLYRALRALRKDGVYLSLTARAVSNSNPTMYSANFYYAGAPQIDIDTGPVKDILRKVTEEKQRQSHK